MKIEKLFERYQSIISDYQVFVDYLKRPLRRSFRVNTLKANREDILRLLADLNPQKLPFYDDGYTTAERAPLGNHIAHNLGLIYVQEIASMVPVRVLDPKTDEYALDLCASPGSKATQIGQAMRNSGLIVINEMSRSRIAGLAHNIKRCGLINEVLVNVPGQRIGRILPDYFDRILIDAPCSAEGTIRRSRAVLNHWGEKNIERMSKIQKGLIVSGFQALRGGGSMVYSTCTIAPEENEAVVSYLLERFPAADILPVNLPNFKFRSGIIKWRGASYDKRVANCIRILPQDNDCAPFFIGLITKIGFKKPRVEYMGKIEFHGKAVRLLADRFGITPTTTADYALFRDKENILISTSPAYLFRELRPLRRGIELGRIYESEIKPDNDAIQLIGRNASINVYNIKDHELRPFLQGGTIKPDRPSGIDPGFVIVKYRGLPIGIGRYNGQEFKSSIKRARRIPGGY